MSFFPEKHVGPPERTYHGIIPPEGYRQVIIKEAGIRDSFLQAPDGSPDINWGYAGGGSMRLAQALASDAYDDDRYGEAFSHRLKYLAESLSQERPFVLSRDRLIFEALLEFEQWVRRSNAPDAPHYIDEIRELLRDKNATREKLMSLLSSNAITTLTRSGFGLRA